MLNTHNYNTTNFNALGGASGSASAVEEIMFNDYGLQNKDIITSLLIQDSTPERDFETVPMPRNDGQIITGDFWRRKIIRIEGTMKKPTRYDLEMEMDAMKMALSKHEGNFDVVVAGEQRRYIATLINSQTMFEERQGYHINISPFKAEFECSVPFGQSINYISRAFFAQTALSLNEEIINKGTAPARPIIIYNFNSGTAKTSISFKNNTTAEEIILTKALAAGNYIEFDSETMEVRHNGIVQDYSGSFPSFAVGVNSFTLTIGGSGSINGDITIKYKNNFL